MEHPAVSLPSKHPRTSDYEEIRKLTDAYLRKIKRTLQDQPYDRSGALQASLQHQLSACNLDVGKKASMLAFVMHAAEVATVKLAENSDEPKNLEIACQTSVNPLPVSVIGLSTKPEAMKTSEVEHEATATQVKVLHPKAIFKTEQGRKDESEASRRSSVPELDYSREQYWPQEQLSALQLPSEQLYDAVSCPIFSCEELFDDYSDLLLHMRSAHSS